MTLGDSFSVRISLTPVLNRGKPTILTPETIELYAWEVKVRLLPYYLGKVQNLGTEGEDDGGLFLETIIPEDTNVILVGLLDPIKMSLTWSL